MVHRSYFPLVLTQGLELCVGGVTYVSTVRHKDGASQVAADAGAHVDDHDPQRAG